MHNDEFAGHGGSYRLDPKSGKRTLVERTREPDSSSDGTAGATDSAASPPSASATKGDA